MNWNIWLDGLHAGKVHPPGEDEQLQHAFLTPASRSTTFFCLSAPAPTDYMHSFFFLKKSNQPTRRMTASSAKSACNLKDWLVQFSPVRNSSACEWRQSGNMTVFFGMPSAKVSGISVLNLQNICWCSSLQFSWHAKQGISMCSLNNFLLVAKYFFKLAFQKKRNAFQFSEKCFFNIWLSGQSELILAVSVQHDQAVPLKSFSQSDVRDTSRSNRWACEVHYRLLNMTLTCPNLFVVAIAMTQKFGQVDDWQGKCILHQNAGRTMIQLGPWQSGSTMIRL